MLTGLILTAILIGSVSVPFVFADVLDDRKKIEEQKAKEFQKKVLNFDYEKIIKKDKGFKKPLQGETKHKQITRISPTNFKIIHS